MPSVVFKGSNLLSVLFWPTSTFGLEGLLWQIISCLLLYRAEQQHGTVNMFFKVYFDMFSFEIIHCMLGLFFRYALRVNDFSLMLFGLFPIWMLNLSSRCFKNPNQTSSLFFFPFQVPNYVIPFLIVLLGVLFNGSIRIASFTAILLGYLEIRFPLFNKYLALNISTCRRIEANLECFKSFCTIQKTEGVTVIEPSREGQSPGVIKSIFTKSVKVEGKKVSKEERRQQWLEKYDQPDMMKEEQDLENGVSTETGG